MSLKNYFFPELIKVFYSRHNGEIQLIKFIDKYQIMVGGLMESGTVMERVWRDAIKHLLPKNYIPESVLILGFAGGSAAHMLHKHYSKAKITGVEIDPVMIDIAKKYFKVNEIPNLIIINENAITFIENHQPSAIRYSLILADCYKGHEIPQAFSDIKFLKKCVSSTDNFLINRLYWDKHIPPTDEFEEKISKHFSITSYRSFSNKVFLLKPLRGPSSN